MRLALPLLCSAVLLSGCDIHSNADTKNGQDVHIAVDAKDGDSGKVAISVPGLDAKLSIPKVVMTGGHMDIDGMKLAPDTAIKSVDVMGQDEGDHGKGDGNVHMTFTNPKGPAELIAYYRQAASDAGFTVSGGGNRLEGTKSAKKFSLSVSNASGGSDGAIDISGTDG